MAIIFLKYNSIQYRKNQYSAFYIAIIRSLDNIRSCNVSVLYNLIYLFTNNQLIIGFTFLF